MQQFVKAFTLIEVLLVVSIISLVSSISFVNLQDARVNARDTARKENARQVKTAMELYENQHNSVPGTSGTVYEPSEGGDNEPVKSLVEDGSLSGDPGSGDGSDTDISHSKYVKPEDSTKISYMIEYSLEKQENNKSQCLDEFITYSYAGNSQLLYFILNSKPITRIDMDDGVYSAWDVENYKPVTNTWDKFTATLYNVEYSSSVSDEYTVVVNQGDNQCWYGRYNHDNPNTYFFPFEGQSGEVACSKVQSYVEKMFEVAHAQAEYDVCSSVDDYCVCG